MGAGSSSDPPPGPDSSVGDAVEQEEASGEELEDQEDGDGLVFAPSDEDGPSDDDGTVQAAPVAAPAASRGRAKGGKGGRGRSRSGGRGAADSAAPEAAAPAPAKSKYTWKNVADHTFAPRVKYAGSKLPVLSKAFDGLTSKSRPCEWFKVVDAPDKEYQERAANSENYRSWRHAMGSDGKDGQGNNKKCYDGAGKITATDMRLLDASIILNGLDPVVSRNKQHSHERLAIVGHRVGHLFTESRQWPGSW